MSTGNVTLESLTSEIERLQKLIREGSVVYNEVNTRRALVDPLLKALGWTDRSIYSEYTVNYSASFYGEARRKVDYALHEPGDLGALIAFIEAKRVSNDLSDEHRAQIHAYARERNVRRYVLTNGDQWELYKQGKSSPVALSIRKLSPSECARLLLEHFPKPPKPEIAQVIGPAKSPASTMSESDALSPSSITPTTPISETSKRVDVPKVVVWFALCLISFGIVGWITGVLTAQHTQSILAYIGLFAVAGIVFAATWLAQRFFPGALRVTMKNLISTLSLTSTSVASSKDRMWIALSMVCGALGGGVLGHFIGSWTAQPVADALEGLGAVTLLLGAVAVGSAVVTYMLRRK